MRNRTLGASLLVLACALPGAGEERGAFDRTLSVSGPVELDVRTGSGDIVVRRGASGEVRIHGEIRARSGIFGTLGAADKVRELEESPPIEQDGNVIRVGHLEDRDLRDGVSIRYEIVAPEETSLVAKTGSGDQSIGDIRGPLEVSSGSGDLVVGRIEGDVEARAGSGDIRIAGAGGALTIHTGSGDIDAEGAIVRPWTLDASSGDVGVRITGDGGFDLYARTSSGDIDSDFPITVSGKIKRRELRGAVRGGGPELEIRTSSGDIRIR